MNPYGASDTNEIHARPIPWRSRCDAIVAGHVWSMATKASTTPSWGPVHDTSTAN